MTIIITFTGCTIAPNAPSDGIWYCEELKLAIEFGESKTFVYSYDENLSDMNLQLRNWIDGGFDIICDDAEGEIIEIYTGWRKYKSSDKFIISMYSKANSDDNFKTQIALLLLSGLPNYIYASTHDLTGILYSSSYLAL